MPSVGCSQSSLANGPRTGTFCFVVLFWFYYFYKQKENKKLRSRCVSNFNHIRCKGSVHQFKKGKLNNGQILQNQKWPDLETWSTKDTPLQPRHCKRNWKNEKRVEAVWDSSLHNSDLLNRPGGQIWLTISAYVDLQQCTQPVCISRDVCVQVFPRDARLGQCRSLRQVKF